MNIARPANENFLIRHATAIATGTVTFLMLLAALSFWRQEEASTQARGWLVHTHEVLGHIEVLQGKLEDAETGQRGYLLTGSEEYLEPYQDALRESELRSAIQLDPSQADYHDWLGLLSATQGHFDEGLQQIALAHANDPRSPSVYSMEGVLANFARRDQQAIAAGKTYLAPLPNLPLAHNTMAWIDFKAGRYQDAIAEWHQMAVLQNDTARIEFEDKGATALKTKGIRAYAQLHLDAIQTKHGTSQWNDFNPSEWYACAGKREESIAQMEGLANDHSFYVLQIAVDPLYDSFHEDPRYLALLSLLGLRVPSSLHGVNSHLCEDRP
jgi:tetratricopeptide (TPR) repeat protein